MRFREKLNSAAQKNSSLLCVGLDPDPARVAIGDTASFLCAIVEATSDLVCAFKPQSAFFEALGVAGWEALQATIAAVPDEIPVILDVKRGDVSHTAAAYATARAAGSHPSAG